MDSYENTGNEAAKSLQTLSLAVLIIVFSAYTFLPRDGPNMSEYQSARYLSAWMALNNLASSLTSRGTLGSSYQLNWTAMGSCEDVNPKLGGKSSFQTANCFDSLCEIEHERILHDPGVGENECDGMSIATVWPGLRVYDVELHRVLGPVFTEYFPKIKVENYSVVVKGNDGSVPFSEYSLMRLIPTDESRKTDRDDMRLDSERWVVTSLGPGNYWPTLRDSRPLFWDRTSEFLRAFGRRNSDSLPVADDPSVQTFFTSATGAMSGMDIIGLHLDTSLYISGVGLLMGVVTLAMYAPILALKNCREESIQPLWILLIPTEGKFVLEMVLCTVSVALAIAPLGIMYMQFRIFRNIYPSVFSGRFLLLKLGGIGLLWSSYVLGMLAAESRHRRTH